MASIEKHQEAVAKYASKVDKGLLEAMTKTYRLVLSKKDSESVACGDPEELKRIRQNFLKKKLGRTETDEKLDKAIKDVCEKMKDSRAKSRLAFYYLLAVKYKAKDIFVKKA